ncbi:MAG: capsule biosynthesis protein CapA [Silicimonas sp.]|jgi:capsular polysaccharide export protein|nr:capsule biosynthesis protein CapA [Silicimonas sp.]
MAAGHITTENRRFLFLQGPHGPFFSALAGRLRQAGAACLRIGFNSADRHFWRAPGYTAYRDGPEEFAAFLTDFIQREAITDVVLYGSSRPVHRAALSVVDSAKLTPHVFEEGYLRPYWVTYERGGANADSAITRFSLEEMANALERGAPALHEAPDRWGDMRAHMFWGAAYHARLLVGNNGYPGFRPHRTPDYRAEFRLHLNKLITAPGRTVARSTSTLRVRHGGFPYHLVLLQLAHDANFLEHGPFPNQATFLETVFNGFATGAPRHHHLVLKAHPLEDGREPLRPLIRRLTRTHGLSGRVHFLTGGKLARLLDTARSALTVNSTSAEQALWRALPLKAFGDAVYNRPEFVSSQPMTEFFSAPTPPDLAAYLVYRSFLLATSQVPGGFYGYLSRRKLLRQLPDLMLSDRDPYQCLLDRQAAAGTQHIRLVR